MNDPVASILLVDDERLVRETLRNTILEYRPSLRVLHAEGGSEALRTLETSGPVQVVISDMRMPEMDGATLLERVRDAHPTAVRILLTAHADVSSAQAAINQGQIFRFLTKPCPTETLLDAIDEGLREEARLTAQQRLLEETFRGSVKALAGVLALADADAFGRTERVQRHVSALLDRLGVADRWSIEVAASLWQIGWIALPPETARRLANGEELSEEERSAARRTPQVASELLSSIPRLEPVRAILEGQSVEVEIGEVGPERKDLPLGVRVLQAARDLEALRARGLAPGAVHGKFAKKEAVYGRDVVHALAALPRENEGQERVVEIQVDELRTGMRLAEDVYTATGMKIIREGAEVSGPLLERIRTFATTAGIREPLKAYVRG